jgi:undecaprenyl-diphosphatase
MQRLPRRMLGLLLLATIICWSRVYVGTHYITDVIGGAFTGVLSAIIVRLAYREGTKLDRFATGLL